MIIYIVTVCCLVVILIYRHLRWKTSSTSKFMEIPLEKGLPIIGVVNNIKEPLCNYLFKLGQKHGPLYRVKFGMRTVVIINTFEYVKAAFVESGDAFNGRWKAENYIYTANDAGLFFISGKVWAEQRSFVLKTLKDFGVGRSRSLEIVQEECAHMLEELDQVKGERVNLTDFMSLYSLNVISKFVMSRRFSRNDRELQALQKYLSVLITQNDKMMNFFLMFPFFDNHVWLMKFIVWITSRKSFIENSQLLIKEAYKEHLSRIDFNSEGNDLIDRFLIKQHQMKERKNSVGSFTDFQLIRNTFDLLIAGTDSTAITLGWSVMFMAMYPDIQNKVHEEIVDKIGNEKMPAMSDKASLIYTQAVMDEVFRLGSIAPISDRLVVSSNVNVKGYSIPLDTIILANLFGCHLDPKVWEKPFEFHPEHFLLTDSNGKQKYRPRDELIVFSMGKRQCLGESLARMEFFIFFISILQKFEVGMVNKKSSFDVFGGKDGILRKPDVEEFTFIRRP